MWIAIDKYLISVVLSSITLEDKIFLNDESRIFGTFLRKKGPLCKYNTLCVYNY